jgi:hypothetical protein
MNGQGITRRRFLQFAGLSGAAVQLPLGLDLLAMSSSLAAAQGVLAAPASASACTTRPASGTP